MYIASLLLVIFLSIVSLSLLAILLLMLVGLFLTRVPFVPVRHSVTDALPGLLNLTDSSVFYDLGCGDGRVVTALAATNPKVQCVGVEISPLPYALARLRAWRANLRNARIIRADFNALELGNATHLFLYLLPHINARLLPKLEAELRAGARVVICDFPLAGRTAAVTQVVGAGTTRHTLYAYDF